MSTTMFGLLVLLWLYGTGAVYPALKARREPRRGAP